MDENNEKETSEIAKQDQWTIHTALAKAGPEIDRALAGAIPRDQFLRIAATVWQTGTASMHKANFRSFVSACVEAAQLGLSPDKVLGECYLIPRKNKAAGCILVGFQMGYRGAMKIARRGGEVLDIQPELIYENDDFKPMLGTSRGLHHIPWYGLGLEDGGEIVGAYCTARLRDGTTSFRVVTKAEIDKIAKSSGNPFNDTPSDVWREWYEPMALKTAVIRLCKFLPIPDAAKRAMLVEEYRDAGVPEYQMTVSQVDETSAHIANMRQDPKELERKAGEKAEREESLEKPKAIKAKTKRIKESPVGQSFFKQANCNRDTETFRAFVAYAAALEKYPTNLDLEIESLDEAMRFLIQWETGEDDEANAELARGFDERINGKPEVPQGFE